MTTFEIQNLIKRQRQFFLTGETGDVQLRIRLLKNLKACIQNQEAAIGEAIRRDLGKSRFESYMCETGMVLSELSYMLKHIRSFAKEKTVRTPLAQFPSRSFQKPSPYGVVLVMSPWNYPFMLAMEPLIDAIAAGNTVVLKPSAYSPHTSALIKKIVQECFPDTHAAVVTGGRQENTCLLQQHFDYIFFTGSQAVGREVMKSASSYLTPVTLELGGKSPCIVDETANLKLAARRIVFGKYLNCGQTCVAPDYLFCHREIKDQLLFYIKKEIQRQFGAAPLSEPSYGNIINQKHFDRILSLIEPQKVVWGGQSDPKALKIAPTVMDGVTFDDAVMQQEIFGPVLPVLTFSSLNEAIADIQEGPRPLALYLFTSRREAAKKVTSRCGFGGGCINDTIIHLATSEMGFGGFGESGMGAYHGKAGFDTFSHTKSIVDKKTWLDLPMRYQPYRPVYDRLIHHFLK